MSDKVIKGNDQSFDKEISESATPVFVDFWADWCAPCRMIGPFIEQIAKEYDGKLKVIKCNVDECPESAAKFQVSSIPALLLFKDGKLIKTTTGALPLVQMKAFVEEAL
ncbi:MAG: thioredoxin [Spirochaetota bacterium]|nr:thioredoxin [Spirochaetota bacterium]